MEAEGASKKGDGMAKTVKDYRGATLALLSHYNSSMDMDYYSALVWDAETGKTMEVYGNYSDIVPDATEDVLEAALASYVDSRAKYLVSKAEGEAADLRRGSHVKVVRGRKVEHGTEGTVFWLGSCRYNRYATRVGFNPSDGGEAVWIDSGNLEVTPDAEYLLTYEDAVKQAGVPGWYTSGMARLAQAVAA